MAPDRPEAYMNCNLAYNAFYG